MDSELERRRALGFKQAEGLEPLPQVLRPRTLSPTFRQVFHYTLKIIINAHVSSIHYSEWESTLTSMFSILWMDFFHEWSDSFPPHSEPLLEYFKKWLIRGSDADILEFLQLLARQDWITRTDLLLLSTLVDRERIAYSLVGEAGGGAIPTLFPKLSEEQAGRLAHDVAEIERASMSAAARHLRKASEFIQSENYKDSVRESISAVESVARVLLQDKKPTLGEALNRISKANSLHPAFLEAFKKLYGWTSDEHGIRHASVDPAETVSESTAIFMLSACAAFSSFLAVELLKPLPT